MTKQLTKQQIISYVDAGYEIEMEDRITGDIYTIIRIYKDKIIFINPRIDEFLKNRVGSFVKDRVISIRPRPFTPLPNGVRVKCYGKTYEVEAYLKNVNLYVLNSIDNKETEYVMKDFITPIIEEQDKKEEWEDEYDDKFNLLLNNMEEAHKEIKDFSRAFMKKH